jgi:hypothetical protein
LTSTLRGPKRTVDVKVKNHQHFDVVKVGDQVQATYTEEAVISVEPAKPRAPKKQP